jgi:Arc/MetJ-type ribon-helix-helix transcriptional regulator
MSVQIPSDFAPFVKRLVDSHWFLSEEDVIAEGLRMLRASETLKDEVEKGFDELDRGLGADVDGVFERLHADLNRPS